MDKKINANLSTIDYSTKTRISSLIDKFKVKILYLGKNRNGTIFTKEVVEDMISSMGGIPIIGQYDEEGKDFLGHGELELYFNDNNGEIEGKYVGPVPYGFIPANPTTWWETNLDKDGVEREYLCTEAYLWTGRYPELELLKDGENNQSLEINPKTQQGHFELVDGENYYVYQKAEFLGLCILGKEWEPCFEGASFNNFSLNENISNVLFTMKEELAKALEEQKQEEEIKINDTLEEEKVKTNNLLEDKGLDDLEGPTDAELIAIEKQQELEAHLEKMRLEYEALENKYRQIQENLESANRALSEYQEKEAQAEALRVRQEKESTLKNFADDLTDKQYEDLFNRIDSCDEETIIVEATKLAYSNVKKNISRYTLRVPDKKNIVRENSWEQQVLKVQEKMED